MAHPDIVIAGAQFPAVPSIVVPKVDGGEAQFFDMGDEMSYLGADVECLGNVYEKTFTLAETGYNTWTPSTKAKVIVASVTKNAAFVAQDMSENDYHIVWECGVDVVYDGTETQKALTLFLRALAVQQIYRRPASWTSIEGGRLDANVTQNITALNLLRYYGTTTGTLNYAWSPGYGFYIAATVPTLSSATVESPNVNVKSPTLSARCHSTYFSTGNAALVNQEASTGFIRAKAYRVKRNSLMRGVYDELVRLTNEREAG